MNQIWERIRTGAEQLGAMLPALVGAGAILLTGYFLARQIERWTDHLLQRMEFNKVARAGGLAEAVERTGSRLDPAHTIGKLLFWLVMLVVILLSSMALGLDSINQMFGLMLSYIPTLIAGIIIVILGLIVGEFVRAIVLASAGNVAGVPMLARLAKVAIILIAVFMALQQIGVAAEIVTAAFTLILGAVALGVGLAFGLGNRDLAGEITRRWYEEARARRTGSREESQQAQRHDTAEDRSPGAQGET
jgi:small-conductance mechanosensitive channel